MTTTDHITTSALNPHFARQRQRVNQALDRLLPPAGQYPESIHEAMRYSIFVGGKRVRPLLLLETGEAFGGPSEALLDAAAAVEMVHTYSLVHDDLPAMDNDNFRRGMPTSHVKFGEATAILAGDGLLTLAFEVLAHLRTDPAVSLRAIQILSAAIGTIDGMIAGQVMDMKFEGSDLEGGAGTIRYQAYRYRPSGSKAAVVPGDAVQIIGNRSVVYLADPSGPGLFIEREVRVGAAINDQVEIVSGVQPGDPLVVKGSFALRAERERLGLRPAGATGPPPRRDGQSSTRVIVSEKGFEPSRILVKAGAPARITFVRTTEATCATEIAIPSLEIRRALPLNQPVEIEFVPKTPGEIAFACGMAMFKGTVVVE